jgi:hypothetical protein
VTGVAHFDGGSFWVAIRVDISDPLDAFIELTHQTRDSDEGDRIVRDRVRLIWTVPSHGGRRWWFQCPRTGRRTTKLFCQMADDISRAAKPTASGMRASVKIASVVFRGGLPG